MIDSKPFSSVIFSSISKLVTQQMDTQKPFMHWSYTTTTTIKLKLYLFAPTHFHALTCHPKTDSLKTPSYTQVISFLHQLITQNPLMHWSCLPFALTHWGRVMHICVFILTIIGSDNGLSPGRRQAIIRTNAGILSIGPLGTNFSEILIGMQAFSFKKKSMWKSRLRNGLHFVSASMC